MDILFFLSSLLFSMVLIAIARFLQYNSFNKLAMFSVALIFFFMGIQIINSPIEIVSGTSVVSNSSIVNITSETRNFVYTQIHPDMNNFIGTTLIFVGMAILALAAFFLMERRGD